jgi:hypothetical protein
VKLALCDQGGRSQLRNALSGEGPFDLFVEDGNHELHQQQVTL